MFETMRACRIELRIFFVLHARFYLAFLLFLRSSSKVITHGLAHCASGFCVTLDVCTAQLSRTELSRLLVFRRLDFRRSHQVSDDERSFGSIMPDDGGDYAFSV